ncbi:hypothetical protein FQA39_LY11929 [Lamprigera yunnana]|nr:hypothetical protein FQA39_LY11929 [Lamprigera yunnana]
MNFNIIILLVLSLFKFNFAISIHEYEDFHHQPEVKQPPIPILKQEHQQSKEGYKFSYQTGNGIHAEEHGYIKNLGDKKHETLVQHGSVTYHDEHGHPITLTYVADEHGFQAEGAHLPTPPPLPLENQQAIKEHEHLQIQQHYGGDSFDQSEYGQEFHQ